MNRYAIQAQERIKKMIAERCGGSQQVFADCAGINKASVSQYVNGKNAPTNLTAEKIGKAFSVNPAWVMGFDVPEIETEPNPRVKELARKLEKLTASQFAVVEKMVDALLD